MTKRSCIAVFLALFLMDSFSLAESPRTLSYQGILADANGNPKPDATYAMTFRLYSAGQAGTALWSETQQLGTTRGLFNAVLGEITPFPDSLTFDNQYWLGVAVSPDPELTPRIQLTAAGYSIHAETASVAGTVPDNSIDQQKISSGQVVKSINGIHDNITLSGGGGTTVSSNGNTITITSSGSGGTGIQGVQNTDNTMDVTNPNGPTATINLKSPLSLSGRVGIGTSNPGMSLEVTTPSYFGMPAIGASSGSDYAYLHVSSVSDHSLVWNNARAMRFGTETGRASGYVEHMRITPDGKVGIGTSNPTSMLEIAGQDGLAITGYQPFLTLRDGSSSNARGAIQSVAGAINLFTNSYLTGSNLTAFLTITNNGNVGIGTSTPSARLEVATSSGLPGAAIAASNSGFGYGIKSVSAGIGVYGSSSVNFGVQGLSVDVNGVQGESVNLNGVSGRSTNGTGVYGTTTSTSGFGVYGINTQHNSIGFLGGPDPSGFGYSGVVGDAGNGDGYRAIHGIAHTTSQFAGVFDGQVQVTTDLWVLGTIHNGAIRETIDHPADQANKSLVHTYIGSSEQLNLYTGNTTTDENGDATVQMPAWFDRLNTDLRYQLTIVGEEFAQARISRKMSGNRFSIKTDKPNIEVSWEVTGVRSDSFAKAHPLQVEVEKTAEEKRLYEHPELRNLPSIVPKSNSTSDEARQQ